MDTNSALRLLPGQWVMHIYLRDKAGKPRLFEDQVEIRETSGALGGQLTVPGAFTTKLENFVVSGRHFAFEIEADEGRGKFRVRYEGDLHAEDDRTFVGFGNVLVPERGLLGGFVGQRLD